MGHSEKAKTKKRTMPMRGPMRGMKGTATHQPE
jgi:hypothetical protein